MAEAFLFWGWWILWTVVLCLAVVLSSYLLLVLGIVLALAQMLAFLPWT